MFDIAKKALKTKVMKEVFIENIDENATFLTATKTLLDCRDKNIACPFFSFKYPIYDIKARTDGKVRIDGKVVARIYGIAYSTSTLTRYLTGFTRTKTLRYFTNYKQIKFKDGNLYNACADNLEWVESGGDIDEEGLVVNDNDNKRLSFQD